MSEHALAELNRVGHELKDKPVALLCQLWDPENPDQPVEVPSLANVETLSADEKIHCFLLSMSKNCSGNSMLI